MTGLKVVPPANYAGAAGLAIIRQLQSDLVRALEAEDWGHVQHLDAICALIVDRVIAEHDGDKTVLVKALSELKSVYATLLHQCTEDANRAFSHA